MLDIRKANLDEINRELAAAGFPSNETDLVVARRALRSVYREHELIPTPVHVIVFWDEDEEGNECWQFQMKDKRDDIIDSDTLAGFDPKDIDGAIHETIRILGLQLTGDMFAVSKQCGYAIWESVPDWMVGE
jgi:hypothetical protein